MIAENAKPIIADLHRCIEGREGRDLLDAQRQLRTQLTAQRSTLDSLELRTTAAVKEAQRHGW